MKQHLIPPSPLPYNLNKDPAYLKEGMAFETTLKKLFSEERDGFFVEAGGLDGQFLSNSLWLEQYQGWRGLLLEPAPANFEILQTKHRHCWTSNTCFSTENYATQITLAAPKLPGDTLNNLGLLIRGGAHDVDVKQIPSANAFHNYHHATKSYSKEYCFPLVSYLLALNVSKIDFLSLDTQGSELSILQTIPWKDITVRLVVAEAQDDTDYGKRMEKFMVEKGFQVLSPGYDYWFAKEGDPVISRW